MINIFDNVGPKKYKWAAAMSIAMVVLIVCSLTLTHLSKNYMLVNHIENVILILLYLSIMGCTAYYYITNRRDIPFWLVAELLLVGVIGLIAQFGALYMISGLQFTTDKTLKVTWFDDIYFSVMTWTSVGYGDLVPSTEICRFYASCEALSGYTVMAFTIATALKVLDKLKLKES